MKETIALAIPALSLFIYIIFSSIEFGASLFSVLPSLLSNKDTIKNYMNPLWETTTIFLAFSLISLFSFFPGATAQWSTDLFVILFTFLGCMGVRVVCILFSHYAYMNSFVLRVLYVVICCVSAVLGTLITLYFIAGTWHLPQSVLWWAASMAISAIFFIASAFFRSYEKNIRLTGLVRISGTFFFLTATYVLLRMLQAYPYLSTHTTLTIIAPCVLIICILGAIVAEFKHAYTTAFCIVCIAFAALFWGFFIAHLPYIAYPTTTIASSQTNSASFAILEMSFIVGIIFIVPAFVLLYRLFIFNRKQ